MYSPRTCVDWRISVNLEINYGGDLDSFIVSAAGADGGGSGSGVKKEKGTVGMAMGMSKDMERNKDRMSYRHLAYQIDLTQVAKSEVSYSFIHSFAF